jgi:hypothetical protein
VAPRVDTRRCSWQQPSGCSPSGGLLVTEGPSMADLAYVSLLVGGFALLALMLRGLDAL